VACSARPPLNSSVTLTAAPASGATFTGWGGSCTGKALTCTVQMSAAKSVSAAFSSVAAPGTLTLVVAGRGSVSTVAGRCAAAGPKKTCVQQFSAGRSVTITAAPAAGAAFLGWKGPCTGTKLTCRVKLTVSRTVTANFSGATPVGRTVLTSLSSPTVKRSAKGFLVTLRFRTTTAGLARVRALRAGRTATRVSLRVAAGSATIGPFTVAKSGLYTFEVSLGGNTLLWRTCLGRCGAAAPGPPFLLAREAPAVTRAGDVWSVTLRFHANGISVARVQASTSKRKLVDQRFLARSGRIILGPFLLGPGSYTIRLTATDAYGRTRTLTWIVALAR
jgi:Divergent InlB B-repeat domain